MFKYFAELLKTLKSIDNRLAEIEKTPRRFRIA